MYLLYGEWLGTNHLILHRFMLSISSPNIFISEKNRKVGLFLSAFSSQTAQRKYGLFFGILRSSLYSNCHVDRTDDLSDELINVLYIYPLLIRVQGKVMGLYLDFFPLLIQRCAALLRVREKQ